MRMTKTILGNLLQKYSTRLHPLEQREAPGGARGDLELTADKCTSCRLCARKCPTAAIKVDPEAGLWEHKVLNCLYCGVCADICPTGSIAMIAKYRQPVTEPTFTRCQVKGRPKKSPASKEVTAEATSAP